MDIHGMDITLPIKHSPKVVECTDTFFKKLWKDVIIKVNEDVKTGEICIFYYKDALTRQTWNKNGWTSKYGPSMVMIMFYDLILPDSLCIVGEDMKLMKDLREELTREFLPS